MKPYDRSAPEWQRLISAVGDGGEELADALGYLYSLYEPELIDWFASLYDPEIGGYYYSESARDNESCEYQGRFAKLLPDAESTYQALRFFRSSGMTEDNFDRSIPPKMKEQIVSFILNLQDPDGFFYHPQWGKNIGISRRGRDAWWCKDMLDVFGVKPKYPIMSASTTSDEKKEILIPDHLKSAESFRDYLSGLDIAEGSYGVGNTLASQINQIKAMGYTDILIDFLDAHQHSESGHWHPVSNYSAINGLMKISGLYAHASRPIPNAEAAACSAIDAIVSDEPIVGIVDLWNTWVSVNQIAANQRRFAGEGGDRLADGIIASVRRIAPAAIRCSRDKIEPFKKPRGAFSYCRDFPAPCSQGALITVPLLYEGDVNATLMGCSELRTAIYSSLGLSSVAVPLYDGDDYKRYLALLEEKI